MFIRPPGVNGALDFAQMVVDRQQNSLIIHANDGKGNFVTETTDLNNFARDEKIFPFVEFWMKGDY